MYNILSTLLMSESFISRPADPAAQCAGLKQADATALESCRFMRLLCKILYLLVSPKGLDYTSTLHDMMYDIMGILKEIL